MTARSILIVEDEAIVARDIQERVVKLGYSCLGWTPSGEEAITRVLRERPDLVLMDIRLKGELDGVEAAERIRAECDTPVVFLTAFADRETLERARLTNPLGYVLKPFEDRDLLAALELAFHKHERDRALREREGLLNTVFEAIPSAAMVLEADGRVVMLNEQACLDFEVDRVTGSGRFLDEVICCSAAQGGGGGHWKAPECHDCPVRLTIADALQGGRVHRRRCEVNSVDNGRSYRRSVSFSAAPVLHQGRTLVLVVLEDATELNTLRELLSTEQSFHGIVGRSQGMLQVFETIREIADSDVPVLVEGETGTGKELVARAIHGLASRPEQSFVAVNCGAIPEGLLESELFGHVKGAFTGAIRDRKGRFALADGGTIFLDEVGELPQSVQVKLLRVLQEGAFEPVGSERTLTVDVRVISATNRDLLEEVNAGRFRSDLYYRLCVVPIRLPPLRERRDDIPLIAEHVIAQESARDKGRRVTLDPEVVSRLIDYPWPGNVREVQNVLRYAWIKCRGDRITPEHLPPAIRSVTEPNLRTTRRDERLTSTSVEEALRRTGGNRKRAAELLGVSRATFYRFLGSQR